MLSATRSIHFSFCHMRATIYCYYVLEGIQLSLKYEHQLNKSGVRSFCHMQAAVYCNYVLGAMQLMVLNKFEV